MTFVPRRGRVYLAAALCMLIVLTSLVPRPFRVARAADAHQVTWDRHSLMIDGKRVFLYSGEFHYFRLPSESAWLDRLEKMKAAGLNAVSIYFDWAYHSNAPGQYDFTGVRDIDHLLSLTDRLGLYVIARVGPYMNAEVDAGGLPGWVLTKGLYPRSQTWNGTAATGQYSALYSQYSKEWYDHLLPILARHQVTTGGSVILLSIENEYHEPEASEQYMHDLYSYARADGISVPIFHNDFYFEGDWKNLVDLYAFDSYPYGFACCHQWYDLHFHGIDTWEDTLRNKLGVNTPMFVSELQGGSFDPWGGQGYDAIANTFGPDWLTDIDQSAIAQGTTILNTYMFTGGTTWGYMTEPAVYTSYDYGAPISESGTLRPAFYSAHRMGSFLQTFGSTLAGADAAPAGAVAETNPALALHTRVDSQSGQVFVFLRHGDPGNALSTHLTIHAGSAIFTVPQARGTDIDVPGHAAEVLTANVQTGPLHLNYSTSQVMTLAQTAAGPYLVLYGPEGTPGETDFALPSGSIVMHHNLGVTVNRQNDQLRFNYTHTSVPRTVEVTTSTGTLRILITTTSQASRYWTDNGLLIAGPDLVTDDNGQTLSTHGNRRVVVYGAAPGSSLQIDGRVTAPPDEIWDSVDLGVLSGSAALSLPTLTSWRFSSEAPEIDPSFDDSAWAPADHTSTANPNVPSTDTLLADDYGFHYGFVWYRGHFTAGGSETGITLQARQSYDVYLNGIYLGSADESLADPPHPYAVPHTFAFPAAALHSGSDNVISVLTESLGHDVGWLAGPVAQSPQGILTAQMVGAPTAIAWKIQGDAGGETPADAERGLFNASGLFGERNGWYLPGFDDSSWTTVNVPDSWKSRGVTAPICWYRTHFTLNIPDGTSEPLALHLTQVSDKAVIWLNGWLIGRYWEAKGPQHDFYLPQGILNPNGDNVLAIAVWNRGDAGGVGAVPTLVTYPSLQSHSLGTTAAPASDSPDYWHTQGNMIVNSAGLPVRIAAVNWGGFQTQQYVPNGLDRQSLDTIMQRIRDMGFNTIRLPFSNQMVESNPVVTAHLDANPDLKGLHALDIMDKVVAAAGAHGLRIILDDHRSTAGVDPELNGLWYTRKYPESAWIADWESLAQRYLGNATVIGADLRDEPHTGPPGPWSVHTYLTQGSTWGPYKGVEHDATDWRLGAERGGDAILSVNPHWLIFVEGIQQYPDPTQPGGIDSYWWGGILGPAAQYPVQLSVPNQLVYSPHEYGPQKYNMPFFGPGMSYASLKKVWYQHWAFLDSSTPIFIGEFGTCETSRSCIDSSTPGSQGLWFQYWMRYLRTHPEIGWSFWALDGTNTRGSPQPNYLLQTDWHSLQLHQLVDALRDVETPPPPAR